MQFPKVNLAFSSNTDYLKNRQRVKKLIVNAQSLLESNEVSLSHKSVRTKECVHDPASSDLGRRDIYRIIGKKPNGKRLSVKRVFSPPSSPDFRRTLPILKITQPERIIPEQALMGENLRPPYDYVIGKEVQISTGKNGHRLVVNYTDNPLAPSVYLYKGVQCLEAQPQQNNFWPVLSRNKSFKTAVLDLIQKLDQRQSQSTLVKTIPYASSLYLFLRKIANPKAQIKPIDMEQVVSGLEFLGIGKVTSTRQRFMGNGLGMWSGVTAGGIPFFLQARLDKHNPNNTKFSLFVNPNKPNERLFRFQHELGQPDVYLTEYQSQRVPTITHRVQRAMENPEDLDALKVLLPVDSLLAAKRKLNAAQATKEPVEPEVPQVEVKPQARTWTQWLGQFKFWVTKT